MSGPEADASLDIWALPVRRHRITGQREQNQHHERQAHRAAAVEPRRKTVGSANTQFGNPGGGACGGILPQSEIRVNLGISGSAPPWAIRILLGPAAPILIAAMQQSEDQREDREDREDQRRRKDRKDQPGFEWRERWRERWSARERYAVEHCHLSWSARLA